MAANAAELAGPGRFCGYSPIVDLRAGERIVTLEEGIHGGRFRWEGEFGTLEVAGIGWGSPPKARKVAGWTTNGYRRYAQRRKKGDFIVALWNGRQGTAYFKSTRPLTAAQLAAVDRVELFQEGENPADCKWRTTFSWD